MGDLLANVFMILPNNGDTALSLWCCVTVMLCCCCIAVLLCCDCGALLLPLVPGRIPAGGDARD
jgi:hypothetical protein